MYKSNNLVFKHGNIQIKLRYIIDSLYSLVWIGLPVLCLTAPYSKQVFTCIPLQGINNAECEQLYIFSFIYFFQMKKPNRL